MEEVCGGGGWQWLGKGIAEHWSFFVVGFDDL